MTLSNTAYKVIRWLVQIFVPILSTTMFISSGIWPMTYIVEVMGTLAIIELFFGVVLSISSREYDSREVKYDGDVVVSITPEGKKLYSLEFNGDPMRLDEKRELRFRVEPEEVLAS